MNLPILRPPKPADPAPNALSLDVRKEPITRALAGFTETGLITPEQQRSLSVAATNLVVMKAVSTPASQRHFGRIDTLMTVRGSTPVSDARASLAGLANVWEGLDVDFHRYRTLFFETRLIKAKLKKRAAEAASMPEGDDRDIAVAEIELEGARLQGMESELAKGHAHLSGELAKATTYADQYKLICKNAGKTEDGFTEADFRAEEIDYYLKSAFWHASQVFGTDDQRDKWDRPNKPPESRAQEWKQQIKARQNMAIIVPEEVKLLFQLLTISDAEVKGEIARLEEQRFNFNLTHKGHESFSDHFDGWLKGVVSKFRDRVVAALSTGSDKLKRIQTLLDANAADGGDRGDVGKINRRSVIQ
jgi:hypothetical protein